MGVGTQDTFRETTGLLSARPTAASYGVGWYFATDVNGGTVYHSDGTAWTQWAAGVTQPAGTAYFSAPLTSDFTTGSLTAFTAVAITGVTTGSISTTGAMEVILDIPEMSCSGASVVLVAQLLLDGTSIRQSPGVTTPASAGTHFATPQIRITHTPTAASHTYSAALISFTSSVTVTCYANSGATGPQITAKTC